MNTTVLPEFALRCLHSGFYEWADMAPRELLEEVCGRIANYTFGAFLDALAHHRLSVTTHIDEKGRARLGLSLPDEGDGPLALYNMPTSMTGLSADMLTAITMRNLDADLDDLLGGADD